MKPDDDDYEFEDFDEDEDERDEYEEAMDNCGQMSDGGCTLVGTEYCDWDCPFSKMIFRSRHPNGRFKKQA